MILYHLNAWGLAQHPSCSWKPQSHNSSLEPSPHPSVATWFSRWPAGRICQTLDTASPRSSAFDQKVTLQQLAQMRSSGQRKLLLKSTCGLMFPRYKLVVDGSPTSWEPGAQSSKTADTEKTRELSYCRLTGNKCFLSKQKIFSVTILSQNYHWKDGFSLKNHPLKEAEKQYKFCFRTGAGKGHGVGGRWGGWNRRAGVANGTRWRGSQTLTRASSLAARERFKSTNTTF